MPYTEVKGNIFNSKSQALVNTVNCVGVMGKGIALEFRLRYPEMFEEYQSICENGKLQPGQILQYRNGNTWILNFAIKNDWKQPSRVEWIENCLKEFVEIYHVMGIKSIAFPWMGAMNGGIPIEKIKEITRNSLSNLTDIDVEVYDFDPDASDPLFEKLNNIVTLQHSNIDDLSKISGIQRRYIVKIINALQQENIKSLPRLVESGIIGKTSVEKLYAFLTDFQTNKGFTYQKTLFS
ncbi:MAG: macro domain-containing protein [Thermoplasmatales archaeon]|nr:macro domain-containing protein [Thermoplasmatales archaeon]